MYSFAPYEEVICLEVVPFLNQAHAGSGLLKLFLCGCLYAYLCVCPPPMLLITSGMMWHDMDSI